MLRALGNLDAALSSISWFGRLYRLRLPNRELERMNVLFRHPVCDARG
jgi:hypothetical protein